MNRQEAIDHAEAAAHQAAKLATEVDRRAHHSDYKGLVTPMAEASNAWAETAKAYAAIAAVLPDAETEPPTYNLGNAALATEVGAKLAAERQTSRRY